VGADGGLGGGGNNNGGGGNGGSRESTIKGPHEGPGGTSRSIILQDFRNVRQPNSSRSRSLFFTPTESGVAIITLEANGLADPEDLVVTSALDAQVVKGRVRKQLTANERMKIDVELAEAYTGPIELRVRIEPDGAAT
jgi:hypothetical protein